MQERRLEEPVTWRVFQRRGTIQVLILLSRGRPMRVSELDRALPFVARQIIGNRLSELGEIGMVDREVFPGPPMMSKYSLTKLGVRLAEAALILIAVDPPDIRPGDERFPELMAALKERQERGDLAVFSPDLEWSLSNFRAAGRDEAPLELEDIDSDERVP